MGGNNLVYLAISICVLFFILGIFLEKRKINALTLFSGLWGIILFLSSIHLFNLKTATDNTYLLFTIGIFSFGIGYIFFRYFFLKKDMNKNENKTYSVRYKIIYVLSVITIAFYLKDLFLIIGDIIDGKSLAYIRLLAQDTNSILYTSRSNIENYIRMVLVLPFVMALQPIVAIDFILGRRNKKIFILNIVILILRSLTDGSRVMFIYFAIHLVLAFLYSKNYNYKDLVKKNKNKILIFLLLIVGLFLVYKTTMSRSGDSAFKSTYYYYSMEPYMFEVWKDKVDEQKSLGFGLASSNGYVFPTIFTIKNALGLENYPEKWYENIYLLMNDTDKDWQIIAGRKTEANAYVSLFWFFYLDGKVLGIIFGDILYALILAYAYSKLELNKSARNLCIYFLLLQGIIFSYVRFQFANETYALSFLFVLLMYKKDKYKGCKNEKRK